MSHANVSSIAKEFVRSHAEIESACYKISKKRIHKARNPNKKNELDSRIVTSTQGTLPPQQPL